MRRLLGVLRHDEDAGALEPQPTLAQAGRLVEQARARGLEVAVEIEGERVALPAGIDLAVYRVLQETLELRAADGAKTATVVIAYGGDELRLEIRDDRPAADSPAETLRDRSARLGLYGGRVRAEPRERRPGPAAARAHARWKVSPHEPARRAPAPGGRPRLGPRAGRVLLRLDGPLGPGLERPRGPARAESAGGHRHDPPASVAAPPPCRRGGHGRDRRADPPLLPHLAARDGAFRRRAHRLRVLRGRPRRWSRCQGRARDHRRSRSS